MVSTRGQRAARTQIVSLGFGPGRGIADDHPPDHQLVDGPSVSLVRETAFSDVFPMRSLTPREELILGPFCPGSWPPLSYHAAGLPIAEMPPIHGQLYQPLQLWVPHPSPR